MCPTKPFDDARSFEFVSVAPLSGRAILAAPGGDPSLGPPLAVRAHHRHDVVLQVDAVEAGRSRVRPGAAVADERIQRAVAELYVIKISRNIGSIIYHISVKIAKAK